MPESYENVDDVWSSREGKCQACDCYGPVNDLSLCENCAAMLERDLLRQRDWEYSAAAFGLSPEAQEKQRRQIVEQFGEALELIAPANTARKSRASRKRRKRKEHRK